MKIGLKVYPDKNGLGKIREFMDLFKFYEVFITPGAGIEKIKKAKERSGVAMTIHAMHAGYGFDLGDPGKKDLNRKLLKEAIDAADEVEADYIVVHTGQVHKRNYENSARAMIKFLDKFYESDIYRKRKYESNLVFENILANKDGATGLFTKPSEMKELIERYEAGFVLDIAHAAINEIAGGRPPFSDISEFLKLKPVYFHVSGFDPVKLEDEHKNLSRAKGSLMYFESLQPEDNVILEVPPESKRQNYKDDIEILRSIPARNVA